MLLSMLEKITQASARVFGVAMKSVGVVLMCRAVVLNYCNCEYGSFALIW